MDAVVGQFTAVFQAPIPFILAICGIGALLWRGLQWKFDVDFRTLERRLSLRDDEIAELKRGQISFDSRANALPVGKVETVESVTPILPTTECLSISRVPIQMNPETLMSLYAHKTKIQADAGALPYIGKWIVVEGNVRNVSGAGEYFIISLGLVKSKILDLRTIWLSLNVDIAAVEAIQIGQTLRAGGIVDKISQFDLHLENCELIF